jgi:hypothetical protein
MTEAYENQVWVKTRFIISVDLMCKLQGDETSKRNFNSVWCKQAKWLLSDT